MDAYDILLEQRRKGPWRGWPEKMRSVLLAMAQQRSRMRRARSYVVLEPYRRIVAEDYEQIRLGRVYAELI